MTGTRHTIDMPRSLKVFLGIAAMVLCLGPTCWTAQADSGAPSLSRQIADRVAAVWPARQAQDGAFDDYVLRALPGQTRDWYGPAMLGSALVLNGQRSGNQKVFTSGLKSVAYAISRRAGLSDSRRSRYPVGRPSGYAYPFSMLALADAWNTGHQSWPAGATKVATQQWLPTLLQAAPIVSPTPAERPSNQMLLEHVEWQALIASSLTSNSPNAIVARPDYWRGQNDAWVDAWLAKSRLNSSGTSQDGKKNLLLSDFPSWPHAYHALSAGLLARMIHWSSPARKAVLMPRLREAVRASRILSSPAGDVAYGGRSSMMPWALSFTAYAALVVANDPSTSESEAADDRSLAKKVLQRLSSTYFNSSLGLMLMPSMAGGLSNSLAALDPYPCAAPYAGLTLLGLEWAGAEADGPAEPWVDPSSPVAERVGGSYLGSSLAVLNSSSLWLGIRGERHDYGASLDLRYDLGPAAAQQKVAGVWRWLLPVRPIKPLDGKASWLRVYNGRTIGIPTAKSMSAGASQLQQTVQFYAGSKSQSQAISVVYSKSDCGGLHVSIQSPSTGSLETVFWLPYNKVVQQGLTIRSSTLTINTNLKPVLRVAVSGPSASHSRLNQVALRFPHAQDPIQLDLCLS